MFRACRQPLWTLVLCALARASEWHVDPLLGDDVSGDGSTLAPFRTITRALGAAGPGDQVRAHAGVYLASAGEVYPLRVPSGVEVTGEGRGMAYLTVFGGLPAVIVDRPVTATTMVGGFTLRGSGTAIEVTAANAPIRFVDLRIEGAAIGVRVAGSTGALRPRFERCTVAGATSRGFWVEASGDADVRPTLVNCTIHGCAVGAITLRAATAQCVVAPTIAHCSLHGNGRHGVELLAGVSVPRPSVFNSIVTGHQFDLEGVDVASTGTNLLGNSSLIGQRGNFAGDPRFVDGPGGDLHLLQGSAAADRADPGRPESPAVDVEAQDRTPGVPDVGADEYVPHTLYIRDDAGMHPSSSLRLRQVGVPGHYVTVFLSYGALSPGFAIPGLSGRLRLDIGLLLLPVAYSQFPASGWIDAPVAMPMDDSLVGVQLFYQSVGFAFPDGQLTGGWSNLLSPTFTL